MEVVLTELFLKSKKLYTNSYIKLSTFSCLVFISLYSSICDNMCSMGESKFSIHRKLKFCLEEAFFLLLLVLVQLFFVLFVELED